MYLTDSATQSANKVTMGNFSRFLEFFIIIKI